MIIAASRPRVVILADATGFGGVFRAFLGESLAVLLLEDRDGVGVPGGEEVDGISGF